MHNVVALVAKSLEFKQTKQHRCKLISLFGPEVTFHCVFLSLLFGKGNEKLTNVRPKP